MTGLEVVVTYLVTRAVQKARRAGGRLNAEADRVADGLLDRLHDAVSRRLGEDPALHQLDREAAEGVENPRTRQRVLLSLEEAAEADAEFARTIRELAAEIGKLSGAPQGAVVQTAHAHDHSTILQAGRDISVDRLP
ncbi:hypothetical protein V2S66_33855 [Streptomyces sp. V4-01]|uniref:Uncharacterized protein n=1 Tax=Actinacidiphila polyblastidii TaxID=3110430 RepID=A0ABU7PM64_9ACTN|nr:hypothetical protein [Streptomyces sp. V4-01]